MSHPNTNHTLNLQSFDALHRTYHERLLRSIAGMVRDHDKAEDITAKTFQRGWTKRDQFRGEASAYTWLQMIARNEVRHVGARPEPVSLEALPDVIAEPGDLVESLEQQDTAAWVNRALEQIPATYRRLLIARFLHGQSTHQVAKRLGIPFGTVLSRVSKAKKLLRRRLEATP
jgi:RNA polymerase sigma-70 factor, ECF subfamily